MALPILILAGSAAATGGALVYDFVKSTFAAPTVEIQQAEVSTATSDTKKATEVLKWAVVGSAAWVIWKKLKIKR